MKKKIKKVFLFFVICCVCGAVLVASINLYVVKSVEKRIISEEKAFETQDVDCILVLGCGVKKDGTPSHMLEDRLLQATALYDGGASSKIIASGDHGSDHYDETNTMKNFLINKGIASEDIFMDHAGFSTYDSIYRAKEIFKAKKVIIVTQEYHLYRALYIAKALGLEAYGVASDQREYFGQINREVREILARNKDFLYCIFKPEPTFLGEVIPISGDGNLTAG